MSDLLQIRSGQFAGGMFGHVNCSSPLDHRFLGKQFECVSLLVATSTTDVLNAVSRRREDLEIEVAEEILVAGVIIRVPVYVSTSCRLT